MGEKDFGFIDLGKGIVGIACGSILYPLFISPRVLKHLPKALKVAYKVTYRTTAIGPNLKAVVYTLLPVSGLLVIPLVPAVTALAGIGLGAHRAIKDGVAKVPKDAWDLAKEIGEAKIGEALVRADDYMPKALPDGEKPFDIRVFEAAKGVLAGLGCAAVSAVVVPIIAERWLIPHLNRRVWANDVNLPLNLLIQTLATAGLALSPVLAILGGLGHGLYRGCRLGYTKGFRAAFTQTFKDFKDMYEFGRKTVEEMKHIS